MNDRRHFLSSELALAAVVVVASLTVVVAALMGADLNVLLPVVVSVALLIVTSAQVSIANRQARAADASAVAARVTAEIARSATDQAKVSADVAMRLTTYSHLAKLWYELKARGIESPEFIDPEFTTLYRPGGADELHLRYHVYAWMCWGHAEDCFVNSYYEDPGFLPSIESYKELHSTWLYSPNNRNHFATDFLKWVTDDLLLSKVEPMPSQFEGTGVFAYQPLEVGEYVGFFRGTDRDVPSRMSVQFGIDHHVEPALDSTFRHLNHSCVPNALFSGRNVYAIRTIQPNEEVTIDYNCSELTTSVQFSCACGYGSCVKEVGGWKYLTPQQRQERSAIAPAWFPEDNS